MIGDRFAGEFAREPFRKLGIAYGPTDRSASDIFRDRLAVLNSGMVQFLDAPRPTAQIVGLERRVTRVVEDSIAHCCVLHDRASMPFSAATSSARRDGDRTRGCMSATRCIGFRARHPCLPRSLLLTQPSS